MAALISIDHSSPEALGFNAQMDGLAAVSAEPVISMPTFASFDQPIPQSPALDTYAYPDPREMEKRMEGFKYSWAEQGPAKPNFADAGERVMTSALDAVGNLFDSKPKLEVSSAPAQVEVGSLSTAMNSLGRADRYAQETFRQQPVRPKGNDFT